MQAADRSLFYGVREVILHKSLSAAYGMVNAICLCLQKPAYHVQQFGYTDWIAVLIPQNIDFLSQSCLPENLMDKTITIPAIESSRPYNKGFLVFLEGKQISCPFCTTILTDRTRNSFFYTVTTGFTFNHIVGRQLY